MVKESNIILFLATWSCLMSSVLMATMTMPATVRDQSPRAFPNAGIDFQYRAILSVIEPGIVKSALNVQTRKPVYSFGNRQSNANTVHNETTFELWFNDSFFTKRFSYNLTLTSSPTDPRIFSYGTSAFFPIDGQGWDVPAGRDQYQANDGKMHNFHFCSEFHGRFAYKGGEIFDFRGDDDLYMFVNNKLALDIGGVHPPNSGSFSLDAVAASYGMTKGNNYRFDLFHCERHTDGSNLFITTSLELFCSYYDWCDICEGDGQSCCPPGACNDNNPCTNDFCSILNPPTVSCQNVPVVCQGDICNLAACNKTTGSCDLTPVSCPPDNDACTLEQCSVGQGGCIAPRKICDDGQGLCTSKSCNRQTGACEYVATVCDDGDECTVDSCSPSVGCTYTTKKCDDSNLCTIDTCRSNVRGGCVFTDKSCDDGSVCTIDSCDMSTGLCVGTPLDCNDKDECTTDTCHPLGGCSNKAITCNDGSECTSDSCNVSSGCVFTHIDGCDEVPCAGAPAGSCPTTDYCNPNLCVDGQCVNTPVDCNDNNACSIDQCVQGDGVWSATCVRSAVNCTSVLGPRADACNIPVCDSTVGCYTSFVCDDGDNCTVDACDIVNGAAMCRHTPLCPSSNPCRPNICTPANKTCSIVPVACPDDGDLCTISTCVNSNGTASCTHPPKTCPTAQNLCSPLQCNATSGDCIPVPVDCNDNIKCTIDSCNPSNGTCSHELRVCDDGDMCTVDSCLNSAQTETGCLFEPLVCKDTICSNSTCDSSVGCVFTPRPCTLTNNNNSSGINPALNFCAATTCDESAGCLAVTRTCLFTDQGDDPAHWEDSFQDQWKVNSENGKKYKEEDCFQAACDHLIGKCVVSKRGDWLGSNCAFAYLSVPAQAAVITGGVIAGIVIGAVVFAALAGFGAKKGYDKWVRMKDERLGAASTNPMYAPSAGSGTSALYA
eukprot:TRINITY_DN8979_c0_g1_i1.p1 TRINITY_DN8979_c0_g1~~TRINITY_DN8979_c0_g1_i1.p1  ORF type:complete len:942 (+),score=124.22 TRINITY_DN8979_c0_g1_i1:56-2881(+)